MKSKKELTLNDLEKINGGGNKELYEYVQGLMNKYGVYVMSELLLLMTDEEKQEMFKKQAM